MNIADMLAQAEQNQPETDITFERQSLNLPPVSQQYIKQLRNELAPKCQEHLDNDYKLHQLIEDQAIAITRLAVEQVSSSGVVGPLTRRLLALYSNPCTWRICDMCHGTGEDKALHTCLHCKGAGYRA